MRLCGATGLVQPRLIGRLLRSSGPSPACPPAKCLPVAGQQAGDSVLGICARVFFCGRKLFLRKRSRGGCCVHEASTWQDAFNKALVPFIVKFGTTAC